MHQREHITEAWLKDMGFTPNPHKAGTLWLPFMPKDQYHNFVGYKDRHGHWLVYMHGVDGCHWKFRDNVEQVHYLFARCHLGETKKDIYAFGDVIAKRLNDVDNDNKVEDFEVTLPLGSTRFPVKTPSNDPQNRGKLNWDIHN